ncbi:type II toxin-antitoxin system PemK/MazF family toxin [Hylemonella sp. W303a]|uniref:type II toxin-antitoxin system PemK/MazF family toxin n=1 Tax=Hylemonella sp. W303a TaxID=3389873 RepID=UPI00396AF523
MVKSEDFWIVNLDPTIDSEVKNSRPCVVVSPADLHDHLKIVIVDPMTARDFAAPFRAPMTQRALR